MKLSVIRSGGKAMAYPSDTDAGKEDYLVAVHATADACLPFTVTNVDVTAEELWGLIDYDARGEIAKMASESTGLPPTDPRRLAKPPSEPDATGTDEAAAEHAAQEQAHADGIS